MAHHIIWEDTPAHTRLGLGKGEMDTATSTGTPPSAKRDIYAWEGAFCVMGWVWLHFHRGVWMVLAFGHGRYPLTLFPLPSSSSYLTTPLRTIAPLHSSILFFVTTIFHEASLLFLAFPVLPTARPHLPSTVEKVSHSTAWHGRAWRYTAWGWMMDVPSYEMPLGR